MTVIKNLTDAKFDEQKTNENFSNNKSIKKNNKNKKQINLRQSGGVSQYHRNCCYRQTEQTSKTYK